MTLTTGRTGRVAQLGERLVRNEEAGGSNPLSSTNVFNDFATLLTPLDLRLCHHCVIPCADNPSGAERLVLIRVIASGLSQELRDALAAAERKRITGTNVLSKSLRENLVILLVPASNQNCDQFID